MMIAERLQQIIDYLSISPNAFAAKLGVSQPRMRNYLQGRDPDYETLSKICITFVMIDARWLLTGEGAMLVESEKAAEQMSQVEIEKISSEILVKRYDSGEIVSAVMLDRIIADKNSEIDKRDCQIDELKHKIRELEREIGR